jgi:hypothetical protein
MLFFIQELSKQVVIIEEEKQKLALEVQETQAKLGEEINQISQVNMLLYCFFCSNMRTGKHFTSCSKSANKPSTSCVRTACPKLSTSLEQAVNNLYQAC